MGKLVTQEDLIGVLQGYDQAITDLRRIVAFTDWRTVGGPGESVGFAGAWGNRGGTYQQAQFSRDEFGNVFVRGCVAGGTNGSTAFVLPDGFRPKSTVIFLNHAYNVAIGNDFCRLVVSPDGTVAPITDYGLTEEVWINCQFKFGTL